MIINGIEHTTRDIKVEVTNSELTNIVTKVIRDACKMPYHEDYVIDSGNLIGFDEEYTSHSYTTKTNLGEATEEQKAAVLILNKIHKHLNK